MSTPSSNLISLLMASVPQLRYDHSFYSDFSEFQPLAMGGAAAFWASEESLVPNSPFEYGAFDQILRLESDALSASLLTMSYPLQINVGSVHGIDGFSVYDGGYQPELVQFGEDCCGFIGKLNPVYPVAGGNWGFQSDKIPIIEESNTKVCRYSEEERKERIVRYLKKRNQRNFNKTIKYACRKTLADRRVRVRGRFARNNEVSEPEMAERKHESPTTHHHSELHPCDVDQFRQDEEWLQEMTNFMYLPYVSTTADQAEFAF